MHKHVKMTLPNDQIIACIGSKLGINYYELYYGFISDKERAMLLMNYTWSDLYGYLN